MFPLNSYLLAAFLVVLPCPSRAEEASARSRDMPTSAVRAALDSNWLTVASILQAERDLAADPVSRLLLAHALLATNDSETARRLFDSVQGPSDLNSWLDFARALAAEEPRNHVAHYLLGDAHARIGDSEDAIEEFSLAASADPQSAFPLLARGVLSAELGDYDQAVLDLHMAADNRPDLAETWLAIGVLFTRMGASEGARDALERGISVDEGLALAHIALAAVEYADGNFRGALDHLDLARGGTSGLDVLITRNEALVRIGGASTREETLRSPANGSDSAGTWMSMSYPAGQALPGDIIVRWQRTDSRGWDAWFRRGRLLVPHVGLLGHDGRVYELRIDTTSDGRHGRIYRDMWSRAGRFPEPGFFSVIESDIPINYNGTHTTLRQLPSETKQKIRTAIVEVAESYIGSDTGRYVLAGAAIPGTASQHCGDAVNKILDEALHTRGIQVQRYEGWSAFTKDRQGLVEGHIADWVKDDWLTQGRLTNPMEYKRHLPRVEAPPAASTSLALAFDREAYQSRPFREGLYSTEPRRWDWDHDMGGIDFEPLSLRLDFAAAPASDSAFVTNLFTRTAQAKAKDIAFGTAKELADAYANRSGGLFSIGWKEHRTREARLDLTADLYGLMRESGRHETAEWQHDAWQLGLSTWRAGSRSPAFGRLIGNSGSAWAVSEDLRRSFNTAANLERAWSLLDLPSPGASVWFNAEYERGGIVAHDGERRAGSAVQWTFADTSYWQLPSASKEVSTFIRGPVIETEFRGNAVSYRAFQDLPRGYMTDVAIRREEIHNERYGRFDLTSSGSSQTTRRTYVTYGYRFNGAEQQAAIDAGLAGERRAHTSSEPPRALLPVLPAVEQPDPPETPYRRRDVYDTIKHAPVVPPPSGPPGSLDGGPFGGGPPGGTLSRPKGVLTATIGDAWVDRGNGELLTIFTLGYSRFGPSATTKGQ